MTDFLKARWENLIMANYVVDPELLTPYLPNGVELDYFDGKTYVSLVGFMFKDTKIFNVPIPFIGSFEEVNLRFYVKRTVNDEVRRGVVFISEIIPSKIIAMTANLLYKEHYRYAPTINHITNSHAEKKVVYKWQINKKWNRISVQAMADGICIKENSLEEFIFEHYYGYSALSKKTSLEYKVNHPRWNINYVKDFDIHCCFQSLYGDAFKTLDNVSPHSVMLAEGSDVSVKWKKNYF